ncbi:TolC family protein [uncultured Duncaniella sp.]|uniref:TolC family protein n=1 Tax=uncultured Duncaniella sp. TaxID=2768039 RepID=UPI002674D30D|nr:TolC family protein [uncultured Duncaniella sp.]MCI9172616.1 TolC family protein [Muribaculaceae bacterium]
MKLTRIILSSAILATSLPAMADPWSLDSCINYAVEHNLDVRSALLERQRGDLNVTEAKDRFLPNVSASASQSWNFGRGLTSENTYANRNTSSFGWGANLSLPIFQGLSALRQLRQARANVRDLDLRVEYARDETTLSIMSYYLQALYNKELLSVRREELNLSRAQLARQEALLEGGKIPEVDVLQAKSQVASGEVSVINAENDYRLAMVDLTRALELDNTEGFDILPLDMDKEFPTLASPESVYNNALENYSGIRVARSAIGLADHAISIAKSGYLPQLSFSAGLNSSYYTLSGVPGASFSRQMRDNFSKSLGFSLSIPIFNAFNTRNQIRQAKLQRLNAELELERRESDLNKTIQQAYCQAQGAEARYKAGETAVVAAKAALDAMTEKSIYGRANSTEWEQARTNYITTLSEQVQAKYEMILRNRILNFYNKR